MTLQVEFWPWSPWTKEKTDTQRRCHLAKTAQLAKGRSTLQALADAIRGQVLNGVMDAAVPSHLWESVRKTDGAGPYRNQSWAGRWLCSNHQVESYQNG